MQRAFEYGHPGLLVLGGLRSNRLPPWYEFAPIIRCVESGKSHACASESEFFAILDGYKIPDAPMTSEATFVLSAYGTQCLEPRWTSAMDGTERIEPIPPAALPSLRNRIARLRGLTGCTMTQFFARLFTGKSVLQDCHRFDTHAIETKRKRLGSLWPNLPRAPVLPCTNCCVCASMANFVSPDTSMQLRLTSYSVNTV